MAVPRDDLRNGPAAGESGHRGEAGAVGSVTQGELALVVPPAGEDRALLRQEESVAGAGDNLLGDPAVGEGRDRGECVPPGLMTQAELSLAVVATGEERTPLAEKHRVVAPTHHLLGWVEGWVSQSW